MISKALKNRVSSRFSKFHIRLMMKAETGSIVDKVLLSVIEALYDVQGLYYRYSERIARSAAFARHGWLSYDFDAGYLYSVMEFKLRRVHKALLAGHAIQDKTSMDALKESIKICKRLFDDQYEEKYHRAHDKKYGSLKLKHTPEINKETGKPTGSTFINTYRSKKLTPAQQKQERRSFNGIYQTAEIDRQKDLDSLNQILKKHSKSWWD